MKRILFIILLILPVSVNAQNTPDIENSGASSMIMVGYGGGLGVSYDELDANAFLKGSLGTFYNRLNLEASAGVALKPMPAPIVVLSPRLNILTQSHYRRTALSIQADISYRCLDIYSLFSGPEDITFSDIRALDPLGYCLLTMGIGGTISLTRNQWSIGAAMWIGSISFCGVSLSRYFI